MPPLPGGKHFPVFPSLAFQIKVGLGGQFNFTPCIRLQCFLFYQAGTLYFTAWVYLWPCNQLYEFQLQHFSLPCWALWGMPCCPEWHDFTLDFPLSGHFSAHLHQACWSGTLPAPISPAHQVFLGMPSYPEWPSIPAPPFYPIIPFLPILRGTPNCWETGTTLKFPLSSQGYPPEVCHTRIIEVRQYLLQQKHPGTTRWLKAHERIQSTKVRQYGIFRVQLPYYIKLWVS